MLKILFKNLKTVIVIWKLVLIWSYWFIPSFLKNSVVGEKVNRIFVSLTKRMLHFTITSDRASCFCVPGSVTIEGEPLHRVLTKGNRPLMGYCPQDIQALDPRMTPFEHLKMVCLLRGIVCKDIKKVGMV